LTTGLTLSPASTSGRNVCPHAGACRDACVMLYAGFSNFASVATSRKAKTNYFFDDRPKFLAQLDKELTSFERRADKLGLPAACRLNVASDLNWESIAPDIFTKHPNIIFYDYTKSIERLCQTLPTNYHLTYSFNENSDDYATARALDAGRNVAVVFDTIYNPSHGKIGELPKTWTIAGKTYEVINGDEHDVRIPAHDGRGKIVGLKGKGGKSIVKKGVDQGFIMPTIGGVASMA
jgi:hypothetical protein